MIVGTGMVFTTAMEGALAEPCHPCKGALLVRAEHPDLFDVIGTRYNGGGVPNNMFQLPNWADPLPGVQYIIVG